MKSPLLGLRALARGKPCMVRVPGICSYDPDTTVLAHYRLTGLSGMGIKPPDLCGAWACSRCHAVIDGQQYTKTFTREALSLMHAEGCMRTLNALVDLGVFDGDDWELKVLRAIDSH